MKPLTLFSLKEGYPKIRKWRFLHRYAFFMFFYFMPFLYGKKILFLTKASFPALAYMTASYTLDFLLIFALHSLAVQTWLNLKGTPRD